MLLALSLSANNQIFDETDVPLDSTLEISLITCGPGEMIYELEGHTGLRIKNSDSDVIVNWGLFDFDSPNFIYRFVKGETDYMAGITSTKNFIDYYKRTNREIREQKLDLTPLEASRVVDLVSNNLLPENRIYRYNYVKDNCATRPLRLIEKALGDTIILGTANADFTTFRNEMKIYHSSYPWYQFGIDLALGSGIDYQLNNRDASFAPVALADMLSDARVASSNGRKLVKADKILFTPYATNDIQPTSFFLSPVFVCWMVFLIILTITIIYPETKRISKVTDSILFLIFGLAGCLITFLVFFSEHEATSPNALIFWLNPLCLLVPILIWFKKTKFFLSCYQSLNILLIILMFVSIYFTGQKINSAFIPLILCDALRAINYIVKTKCFTLKKNLYSKH
ncbi:MAG: DUF4105 domain-containing protein [Paramuribaculum sp.]|nr:DUF4105 domain-containing protein [Paramuribaculum sp.]